MNLNWKVSPFQRPSKHGFAIAGPAVARVSLRLETVPATGLQARQGYMGRRGDANRGGPQITSAASLSPAILPIGLEAAGP